MTNILRNPLLASQQKYDLIVVGGGIYGVMLSLEAALRGLRPLLLERADFGGATSYNSLRIIHGGFRYLQTLDLHRFFESVGERRWFLQTFPDLVKPLPCLMPIYGSGLRRRPILRAALLLNDLLSYNRNHQVGDDRHLPNGKLIDPQQAHQIFPLIDRHDLQGGAVWYDACMPDSQRLLISILRWACELGAIALNYVEAKEILSANSHVTGVLATDIETGQSYQYQANIVINAAGPWCRKLAANFASDTPELFRSSLAWNVLFDREALSDFALAVTPKKARAQTYFLHPWKGRFLAGTVHNSWTADIINNPLPSATEVNKFIEDLNQAIPGLNLAQNEILKIFSGLLPAAQTGEEKLAVREVIFDHSQQNNIKGLYSVSGVKFTTSRLVAAKTITKIFPHIKGTHNNVNSLINSNRSLPNGIFDYDWTPKPNDSNWQHNLGKIITEESVQHLDDLIFRRTSLGDNPDRALVSANTISQLFDWDTVRRCQELRRLELSLNAGTAVKRWCLR